MKKRYKIILLVLITGILSAEYGHYGDAYILAGRSSQSVAMGGTGLTSLNGITSVISNPAGLIGYRDKEIFTQFNNVFGLAFQNSIGISMPYGDYQIGALVNTVGVQLYRRDDIINGISSINDRRDYVREFLGTETFYDMESALLLSIARETPVNIKMGWSYDRFVIRIQYGANLKFIYKRLDGHSALGAGLDAGVRFMIPGNEVFYIKRLGVISLGLNMENFIKSPVVWFNNPYIDYGNMRLLGGIALHQPVKALSSEVRFALDGYVFESRFFPYSGIRFGMQWKVKDFLDIRFGKDLSGVSGGAGLKLPVMNGKMKLDYTIQYHEINWSHLISLSYYWGETKQETGE